MSPVPGQPGGWSMSIPSGAGTDASHCSQLPGPCEEEEMLPQDVGTGSPSAVGGRVQSPFPVTWADLRCCMVPTAQAGWGAGGQIEVSGRRCEVRRAGGSRNFPFTCVLLYICRSVLRWRGGSLMWPCLLDPQASPAPVPAHLCAHCQCGCSRRTFLLPELQELLLRVGDGGKLAHEGC